jgi:hypothetical protein
MAWWKSIREKGLIRGLMREAQQAADHAGTPQEPAAATARWHRLRDQLRVAQGKTPADRGYAHLTGGPDGQTVAANAAFTPLLADITYDGCGYATTDEGQAWKQWRSGQPPRNDADAAWFGHFRENGEWPAAAGPHHEAGESGTRETAGERAWRERLKDRPGTPAILPASSEPEPGPGGGSPATAGEIAEIREQFNAGEPDPDIYDPADMAIWRAAEARRHKEAADWQRNRGPVPPDVHAAGREDPGQEQPGRVAHEPAHGRPAATLPDAEQLRQEEEDRAAWRREQDLRRAAERAVNEAKFAAGAPARRAGREERLQGRSPEVHAGHARLDDAMARRRLHLPPRDDYERDLYREWAGLDADWAQAAAEAGQAGREGGTAPVRGVRAAEPQQGPGERGMHRGEQEARQQWLSGGAARDEDEELWFGQFGDEDGSDRSAGELDFIAEEYRAEREKRAAARAQQAPGDKPGREAPDPGEQPGREAQLAAAARLGEAVAHVAQGHAAYEAAQDAERAAPDGSAEQADARAARLAAKEARFYADLEVSDARAKFLWLRRAYSAPPAWLAEASPDGRDARDALMPARGRTPAEPESDERQAWWRYMADEEPANDAQARWFGAYHEAFQRYTHGEAPRDEADRQRFAEFEESLPAYPSGEAGREAWHPGEQQPRSEAGQAPSGQPAGTLADAAQVRVVAADGQPDTEASGRDKQAGEPDARLPCAAPMENAREARATSTGRGRPFSVAGPAAAPDVTASRRAGGRRDADFSEPDMEAGQ